MKKMIEKFSLAILVVTSFCFLLRPLGKWFWFVDLGTNFLPQHLALMGCSFLVYISLRWKTLKWAAIAIILIPGFWIIDVWPYYKQITWDSRLQYNVSIVSFNVLSSNRSKAEVINWLLSQLHQSKETIIFLMEVDQDWSSALQELKSKFPYSIEIPREDNFGVALFSTSPLDKIEVVEFDLNEIPALVGTILIGGKEIQFYGIHTMPPLGSARFDQRNLYLDRLRSHIDESQRPVILVGDFNCSPWSPNMDRIFTGKSGSKPLLDPFPYLTRPHTWEAFGFISTAIDFILVNDLPGGYEASVGPHMGSDHKPVVLRF